MKKLLKKSILFIMLLLTCIVFTGCNNTDSYDDSEVSTLKVTVDKNLINGSNSSERASYDPNNLNLYYNGIIFQGHSLDSDGNFVFTNVMYSDKAYEMSNPTTTTTTILITVGDNKNTPMYTIICKNIKNLPTNLHINLRNKLLNMTNEGKPVRIVKVNNDIYNSYANLDEIEKVNINKYNSDRKTAKVTFYEDKTSNQGVAIDYESCSWKITAFNSNLEPLCSWTKSDNDTSNNLNIQEVNEDNTTYYIISLTSSGISESKSHNLDNTIVKIDYIRKDGKEIDTDVLTEGMWDYRTR